MPFGGPGPGLVGTVGRAAVIRGTAGAVSGRVHRRQQRKWSEQDQQANEAQGYEQQQAAAQQPAPAADDSIAK